MSAAEASAELAGSLAQPRRLPSIALLPTGLHPGVPAERYHQRELGLVSKHALDLVAKAPATYRAWVDGFEEEQSPAMLFGSALHCAALEPDVFARTYTVEPAFGDCRRKENKERRDAWRAEHAGKTLLERGDGRRIERMVAALRAHAIAGPLLERGLPELTLRWEDPETGLACKGRADWYDVDAAVCIDLKTTEDARPGPFARSMENFRYWVQDGFYSEGFDAIGESLDAFVFIAIEKTPPFLIACYALDEVDSRAGRSTAREEMRTLADCLSVDRWPGYPERVETIQRPRWARERTT